MQIVKRSMNWLPKQSTYNYVQQQNAKRKSAHESFLNSQSSLATTFSSIYVNASQQAATNAGNAALKRVTSASSANNDAIQQALDEIAAAKSQIDGSSSSDGSSSGSSDTSVNLLA